MSSQGGSRVPRPARNAGDQDVFTRWRRLYCYTRRAGVTAGIKRAYRRGERRRAKVEIRRDAGVGGE